MGLYEHLPYTNFHELNLSWLLEEMKKLVEAMKNYDVHMEELVDEWLTAHPEYVTTVVDGSLTLPKFAESLKLLTVKDYVTPEMYGAAGDGVTDDTAAVQSAIDSGVGTVLLLGTYLITAQLHAAGSQKIMGVPGATLLWNEVNGQTSLLYGGSLSDITYQNITFDFGAQTELMHSITLATCNNLKFEGCTFKNSYGYVFRLNESSGILFKDCAFMDITGGSGNPGGAIYGQDMTDLTVIGCSCENIGDHFVYSAGVTEARDIVISDCILKDTGTNELTSGSAICLYANTHDVTITGCLFENCREGIYIGVYGGSTFLPEAIDVTNCVFRDIPLNAFSIFGIDSSNRVKRVSVNNCQILTAGQDGISIRHGEYFQMTNVNMDKVTRYNLEASDTFASVFGDFQLVNVNNTGVIVANGSHGPGEYNIFRDFYINPAATARTSAVGFYLRQGSYNILTNIRADSFPNANYVRGGAFNSWFNANGSGVDKSFFFTTDITEVVYHNVGDVVFNAAPTVGSPAFWVCTVAGSPGTMKVGATVS